MKIAVTYENGEVFQHFGHSEQFKLYEVQDGKIAERGTHEELVKKGGYYARVFEHQYGKEALENGKK